MPIGRHARAGDVKVWEIANLTADVHPMHFHLVNVQVLSRTRFTGYELNPGEVTRVIMQFNMPAVPFAVPKSPRVDDNEFVWHCHILEHEEHDMMRPLVVRGANPRMT